ncbi:MAG TPA: hypothetical protein VIJ04_06145 [Xanthobacteraceae bacterium]
MAAIGSGFFGATVLRLGFAALTFFVLGALARFAGLALTFAFFAAAFFAATFFAALFFAPAFFATTFLAPAFLAPVLFAFFATLAFFAIASPHAVVAAVISIGGARPPRQ